MDPSLIPNLEEEILQGVRKIFTGICFFENTGGLCESGGQSLVVGSERMKLRLRRRRSGHVLMILTAGSLTNFRETRAGWFNIDRIATHIYTVVQLDQKTRQDALRKAQLLQSARNAIERIGKLPPGCELAASTDLPGTLDLTLTGLPEATVKHLLGALESLKPTEASAGLWEHLAEDE
jgi:hypothetical protein